MHPAIGLLFYSPCSPPTAADQDIVGASSAILGMGNELGITIGVLEGTGFHSAVSSFRRLVCGAQSGLLGLLTRKPFCGRAQYRRCSAYGSVE